MKTTKDERAMWGSVGRFARIPTQDVYRLIADVNDAVRLLGVVLEEIKNGEIETNYSQRACAKSIANFLKEPKS